ncbi:MAG: DUF5671 domain-containing protein [Candidatus Altimarinota bacterium]
MAQKSSAAKIMFYYLLVLVALCFAAIGIGQILFQVINAIFPESTYYYDGALSQSTLRFGISSVIVAAPIYWFVTHQINKELERKELDPHSAVRKWLTYLILFVSSIIVLGLLIGILNSFLNGEITVKFILKWLTVLVISGTIFFYYLHDIRREDYKETSTIWIFRVIFGLLAVGALVGGFLYVDFPSEVRAQREDQTRVDRLRSIVYEMDEYYRKNQKLPQQLSEITSLPGQLKDPVTDEPFGYSIKGEAEYELCATFETSNKEEAESGTTRSEYWIDPDFIHGTGKHCFDKEISEYVKTEIIPAPVR